MIGLDRESGLTVEAMAAAVAPFFRARFQGGCRKRFPFHAGGAPAFLGRSGRKYEAPGPFDPSAP